MGAFVSSIFDLVDGDPAKSQENQIGALGGYDTGVGEGLTSAGAQEEEDILSGDPTKIAQAVAPEITAGQQQGEQAKKTGAEFNTRSGGTTSADASIDAKERGNIIDLVGGLQSGTASTAVGQGTNLLGQASSDIDTQANLLTDRRKQVDSDVSNVAQGAADIAMPFLDALGIGGGGDLGDSEAEGFSEGFGAPDLGF